MTLFNKVSITRDSEEILPPSCYMLTNSIFSHRLYLSKLPKNKMSEDANVENGKGNEDDRKIFAGGLPQVGFPYFPRTMNPVFVKISFDINLEVSVLCIRRGSTNTYYSMTDSHPSLRRDLTGNRISSHAHAQMQCLIHFRRVSPKQI